MRALVVLPTYNEIENIETVLRQARAALPDGAVLVVDDGSPDGTADRAEALGAELGSISVLRRPAKAGLGSAYRAGFRRGLDEGYDALIEMDADLSHDPAVLPQLVQALEDGADLAIGSRYVPGGAIPDWPFLRRAISRIGCWYARDHARSVGARRHRGVPGLPRRGAARRSTSTRSGPTATASRSRWRTGYSATAAASSRCRSSSATGRSGIRRCRAGSSSRRCWLVTRGGCATCVDRAAVAGAPARGGDARLVTIREWVVAGALVEAPEGLLVVRNVRRRRPFGLEHTGRRDRRGRTRP